MHIAALLLILVAATILYITRWLPIQATSILVIVALALTGILTTEQALSGFASSATLTVGAMFVLSGGLVRTGALEAVTIYLARFSNGSTVRLLLLLAATIPFASAFMNNTPVVVMMLPVILSLSRQFGVRPSKLLIPVSYFSILGGTMSLLGTSTNILVDDLYRKAGGPGFGLFTFTPLGLIYFAVGSVYLLLFGQRLLPDRLPLSGLSNRRHQETNYVTELIVGPDSLAIGKPVADLFDDFAGDGIQRLQPGQHLRRRVGQPPRTQQSKEVTQDTTRLLELFRGNRIFRTGEIQHLILQEDDALVVTGTPKDIAIFMTSTRTHLASVLEDGQRTAMPAIEQTVDQQVIEAVVLPDSLYSGRVIGSLDLNRQYGVRILGLKRRGSHRRFGLRSIPLESGDVLLLQGPASGLDAACRAARLLPVEGVDESMVRSAKNRVALLIMVAVILLASLTGIPIVVLALAGAGLMVVTRCLRAEEAIQSLDSPTLLLLAATIPLGTAMETSGLAQMAVNLLLMTAGTASPLIFLSAFYLLTSLLTEIISNNAVAVLLTPIALSLATSLDVSPTPLLMAIAFGASASFMTPMGYQTNAIVMGPGGYNVADYLRIGIPLNLLMWLTATLLIPVFWPL